MSVYMTEEEQIENIKKWWARYGNVITICLSAVLLCVLGYRYFNWHEDKLTQQASVTYENMMIEFSKHNTKAVRSYANQLIKDYGNSVYADVAHLTLAKIYIGKDDLAKAKDELSVVAKGSKMVSLKQIAKIRMARILAANKAYSDALNELNQIADNTYLPVINELKGDIYGANGQYKEAITSYRLAIDQVKNNGMGNLFLEMKTNDLAIKNQSMLSSGKKVESA